jgi:hypothetical protein
VPSPPMPPPEAYSLSFSATIDATVESFDVPAQDNFRANLAAFVGGGITADHITLEIIPASLNVISHIAPPSFEAANAALVALDQISSAVNASDALSQVLNCTVQALTPPMIVLPVEMPPSPPSPLLPGQTGLSAGGSSEQMTLGVIVGGAGMLAAIGLACLFLWRKRAAAKLRELPRRPSAIMSTSRAKIDIFGNAADGGRNSLSGVHGSLVFDSPISSAEIGESRPPVVGADADQDYDVFKSLGAVQSISTMQSLGIGTKPLQAAKAVPKRGLLHSFSLRGGSSSAGPSSEATTAVQMTELAGGKTRVSAHDSKVVPWGDVNFLDKLGEGAFGEVYKVDYAHTKCAIKKLHTSGAEGEAGIAALIENLKAEFDVMLQLRHPHVLQMIGFASDGMANHGILMELMEANLNDVSKRC